MKKASDIRELYDLIGFFNDGKFMNQDYRKGVQDTLSFVLEFGGSLTKIHKRLKIKNPPAKDKVLL